MGGNRLAIPIGVDSFREIREDGYYFVDKSELVSDIVEQRSKVYLFTRPRRFGKTLNLSMIDCFFNLKYKDNAWFDGLKVMEHPDAVARMNSRPVIRIDMKDLRLDDYDGFLSGLGLKISDLYLSFDHLNDDRDLKPQLLDRFERGKNQKLTESELQHSIRLLCTMLKAHHGVAPIVLIDEYDSPINGSFGLPAYERILGFLRLFYSSALKGNDDLGFAVVTGVMQIAKETIFSGLNNLSVNSIFSKDFDERYGFTPEEVESLCAYYGRPEAFQEAREWYDGYRFGDAEIYNPWSVLNYVRSGFEPGLYWAGTSANSIIDTLLDDTDERIASDLGTLANGGSISAEISPTVVMSDIGRRADTIYSVMAVSGYLNAAPDGKLYRISIPNKEMFEVFAGFMARRIAPRSEARFEALFKGLESADLDRVRASMQSILDENIPFILLTDEASYQLIIGAAAMCLLGRYTVALEKESGDGRADITMVPNRPGLPNVILELKLSRSERDAGLRNAARRGLAQIEDRQYFRQMGGRILIYGMAFNSKRFGLAFKEMVRRC